RRERHHQADRLCRVRLRQGAGTESGGRERQQGASNHVVVSIGSGSPPTAGFPLRAKYSCLDAYGPIDYFLETINGGWGMDLRDLRYFETIASLEHLSNAARQLHRTQPALTSCIRRLEEDCGAALFERSGRGIRLTAAGATLLMWARRIRQDSEDAKRAISDIGRGLSGHIRIG